MTKKLICIGLSCVLILCSFVACGSPATTPTVSPAAPASPASPTAPAEKEWPEVKLHYLNINSESMGGPKIQALVDQFNSTNGKNITVEFDFISSSYQEIASEVQSYLAAGEDVGVVQVGYSYINYFADNFPQMQNIEKVISDYSPADSGFLKEAYGDAVLGMGYALNGSLAGLPYGMSTPLMYYNADMCKAAGLDVSNPPKTWQEVRVWSEAIKAKTGNYGVALQNPGDTWSILPIFLSSGTDVIKNDGGQYSACFNTEKSVASWQLLQDMKKDGLYVHLTLDEAVASFAGGQIGMFITTSGRANYLKETCKFDVQSTMQPGFEGSELKVCTGGNVLSIISNDPAQIAASWEFIKFLLQPENIGIECAATGYLPPTKNSSEDATLKEFLAQNHLMSAAVAELDYASQWTSWPGKNGLQIDQQFINLRDSILSNGSDVAKTVKDTEDSINKLLK